MAIISLLPIKPTLSLLPSTLSQHSLSPPPHKLPSKFSPFSSSFPNQNLLHVSKQTSSSSSSSFIFHVSYRLYEEEEETHHDCTFDEAVELFNNRDYYKCHDFLEHLWNGAQDPTRTLIHGILQCAVGFHHLFNQNHRGAMMELGEGLCKLRKMNFESGPFHQFEQEISMVLEFVYQTQIELAACAEDICLAMDQTERSYQLLGGYAGGQRLYRLENGLQETMYIVFCPDRSYGTDDPQRVKLPTLHATEEHLTAYDYK